MNNLLAIVIPAYKATYLEKTLASIAAQTDPRFRVYIGDDASPDPLLSIVEKCTLRPPQISYHRFATNLGRESLTNHWERCIRLSSEPWIWLFSDDDLMEPDCVAAFHDALFKTNGAYDLYRMNTKFIDADDRIIAINPPHQQFEKWYEFVYFLLRHWRFGNQQELVFRRERLSEVGGFLDLPLAWWSDIAFTIACGTNTGICTIQNSHLLMRMSSANISSLRSRDIYQSKLRAMVEFMIWLVSHIQENDCGMFPGRELLRELALSYFFDKLKSRHSWITPHDFIYLTPAIRDCFRMHKNEAIARLAYCNWCFLTEELRRFWLQLMGKTKYEKRRGLA